MLQRSSLSSSSSLPDATRDWGLPMSHRGSAASFDSNTGLRPTAYGNYASSRSRSTRATAPAYCSTSPSALSAYIPRSASPISSATRHSASCFADSIRYSFSSAGTTLDVGVYNYVALAWRPTAFLFDWRPAGVYSTGPGQFDPAPVRVLPPQGRHGNQHRCRFQQSTT